MEKIQVTIDGPAGAGKSSVSKILAQRLGYVYIDTGAMYRTLTYSAIKEKVDFSDIDSIIKLLTSIEINFGLDQETGTQKVFCNDQDVTDLIRSPEVNQKVSIIAAILEVRNIMVLRQREIAQNNNVVMDGRDIGTVVLPNAKYKFYLTASLEERAKRRAKELEAKGYKIDLEKLIVEIKTRDNMDTQREYSPLKPASDAIIIDSSKINLEQVIGSIINYIKEDDINVL
ncbi:cytidylate kinase [Desulfonispora thiosulfatigenes DSM 11270]|uniref:Cytidylate kinase n=1 Tax=Desulfonispora thiosulfatigenes DSM 11270 TaxID=656914 RepID=A0A1W1VM71_DESTI|nr:cytidylate kinase [Desulfonispora thiosulfatigenes DSM 11270]